jgi:hypothetical protein
MIRINDLTKRQWSALEFFERYERDPISTFERDQPHKKTRTSLIERVFVAKTGTGVNERYRLTEKGYAALTKLRGRHAKIADLL